MKRLILLLCMFSSFAMQTEEDLSVALQQLNQNLLVLEGRLKKQEKGLIVDVFTQLINFSKLLDAFFQFPSENTLDKLLAMVFTQLTFEGFENLKLQKLREFKIELSKVHEKMIGIQQNLIKLGADASIQEEFNESVFGTFNAQKELIDAYIIQKNLEFQQTLFNTSMINARNQFIKFQDDPTVLTLSRLANSLKFNIRFLDVIDRLDVLSQIFLNFNQLVKDIKNAFNYPTKALQDLAKKTGRKAWIEKYSKEIINTLNETQIKLREYLKNRLEVARKEKK